MATLVEVDDTNKEVTLNKEVVILKEVTLNKEVVILKEVTLTKQDTEAIHNKEEQRLWE